MADITVGGDAGEVSPADPASWTSSTGASIGRTPGKTGTLSITNGGGVVVGTGWVGAIPGGTGALTVTGSNWIGSGDLFLGMSAGSGTLNVANGGHVSSVFGAIALGSGSTGRATLTGAGTTWTTSQGMTVGNQGGTGTLIIQNGAVLATNVASGGTIGTSSTGNTPSTGTVVVSGSGSTWTLGDLSVGMGYSTGTLRIENGAAVSSNWGTVGSMQSATGTATVTGAGSTWTNTRQIYVGMDGSTGTLNIAGGAQVTGWSLTIGSSASSLNLRVNGDNSLVLGSPSIPGSISNGGKVNLSAEAMLASGTYRPIADVNGRAMTFSGTGSYNAVGGAWDGASQTFTVADAAQATAGVSQNIAAQERLIINPAGGFGRVGASFGTVPGGTTFAASAMSSAELASLTPGAGESVLAAWDFSTNLAGQSVVLSFDVGQGASGLHVWHYSANTWSAFDASDLSYGNGVASFTASSFSGYAVTGMVPEPTALGLVCLAGWGLLRRRRAAVRGAAQMTFRSSAVL